MERILFGFTTSYLAKHTSKMTNANLITYFVLLEKPLESPFFLSIIGRTLVPGKTGTTFHGAAVFQKTDKTGNPKTAGKSGTTKNWCHFFPG